MRKKMRNRNRCRLDLVGDGTISNEYWTMSRTQVVATNLNVMEMQVDVNVLLIFCTDNNVNKQRSSSSDYNSLIGQRKWSDE